MSLTEKKPCIKEATMRFYGESYIKHRGEFLASVKIKSDKYSYKDDRLIEEILHKLSIHLGKSQINIVFDPTDIVFCNKIVSLRFTVEKKTNNKKTVTVIINVKFSEKLSCNCGGFDIFKTLEACRKKNCSLTEIRVLAALDHLSYCLQKRSKESDPRCKQEEVLHAIEKTKNIIKEQRNESYQVCAYK